MHLSIQNLHVSYGVRAVLCGVNLELAAGEVVCLSGRNGAGRSTLLKAIAGQVQAQTGAMLWKKEHCFVDKRFQTVVQDLVTLPPYERFQRGISWMPESKEIFTDLTVEENLIHGLGRRAHRSEYDLHLQPIYERYPVLGERAHVKAGSISGGEQQLLAFARAVITVPLPLVPFLTAQEAGCRSDLEETLYESMVGEMMNRKDADGMLLLLDEPTEGLAAPWVMQMQQHLQELKAKGACILLVDQKMQIAPAIADRVIHLEAGHVGFEGSIAELRAYLQGKGYPLSS